MFINHCNRAMRMEKWVKVDHGAGALKLLVEIIYISETVVKNMDYNGRSIFFRCALHVILLSHFFSDAKESFLIIIPLKFDVS